MKRSKWKKAAIFATLAFLVSGCGSIGAPKPSEVIIEGKYHLNEAGNMEFEFTKDSRLTVTQNGIYEFSREDGKPVLRMCFDDISTELPEDYQFIEYQISKDGNKIKLTYLPGEDAIVAKDMTLTFQEGSDKLSDEKPFTGVYQMGEHEDSYQYHFDKDGKVIFKVNETYYADKEMITLSDNSGTTRYLYEKKEDEFLLKNLQGDLIFELVKKTE